MDSVCGYAVHAGEGLVGRGKRGKREVPVISPLRGGGGVGEWELAWLCHQACKPWEKIGFGGHKI